MRLVVVVMLAFAAASFGQERLPEGLQRYEGRYYIIHTDLRGDELREAELRMAKMAEEYHQRTRGFSGAINQKFPFFLFRREQDYHSAGGTPGSAGAFDPNNNTLMAVAGEHVSADTWHVVQHEGFHQFARAVIGGEMPIWVNEGLAEYFGEGLFTGEGFVTGVIPPDRLKRVREQMRSNEFRPIRDIMVLKHADWNADLTMSNYDQAWSMVQFLAHADNGRYQSAFIGFMRGIGAGQKWDRAWLANFGSAEGFEQKWKQYWFRLPENPTAHLYARATMQTLTGALARATAEKQSFATFDELADAAKKSQLRMHEHDWLPPTLVRDAFEQARAMREEGATFTLQPGRGVRPPVLLCILSDGTRIAGRFTIQQGRARGVIIDPPVRN